MRFENNNEIIIIDSINKQVILNNITYDMIKIDLLDEKQAKFTFDKYTVKINNEKLSLYDSTGLINTFSQVKEEISSNIDISKNWDKYIIYKNTYLYIDKQRTTIKINEVEYSITEITKIGSSIVYNTSQGTLSLSTNINRKSTWNGITIELITS